MNRYVGEGKTTRISTQYKPRDYFYTPVALSPPVIPCRCLKPVASSSQHITTFCTGWDASVYVIIKYSLFTSGMGNDGLSSSEHLLTYSMVLSPSWEANWFAASQDIPRISRNPKVHYRTHKRPPTFSNLGQPNPVHIPTSHLLEIRPNIIHPSTPRSPQWSLSLRFSHQDPIHLLSSPIRATCPAHLILLDFITRTLLGEEYKSFSSSLCNLPHSPVTSSFLGPNILLNTMFSDTLQLLFLPQCQRPSFITIRNNRQNYNSIYLDL